MTEKESAELIIKQKCNCFEPIYIKCEYCPAERIREDKEVFSCSNLWNYDIDKKSEWFKNWLKNKKV